MKLELEEGDRQLLLLALAVLSLESPGFDYALNAIAVRIDNVHDGRAVMYDEFRELRKDDRPTIVDRKGGGSARGG
jgi:hypothetical protein